MFGAEPASWNTKEAEQFEAYATAHLRRRVRQAFWAAVFLAVNVLAIIPFLAGHSLHEYWPIAKYLLFSAEASLVWFLIKASAVWAAWYSARETRREFGTPSD